MPFTDIATVRKHLYEEASAQDSFRDATVQLVGVEPSALMHGNIRAESVVVKGKELGAPQFAALTLADAPVSLGQSQVIPDSVVVARDSSLGKIYTENVDYHVDYRGGLMQRLESGSILSGASVVVWFYAYRVHTEGVDFYVDYEQGTLRRSGGSAIEDGQTVFVDYETSAPLLTDDQISNAIIEADDRLRGIIDSAYYESTDQALVTAETYLTMSILCRIKAVAGLQAGQDNASAARSWQELADKYERDAFQIAARFRVVVAGFAGPVGVKGGGTQ